MPHLAVKPVWHCNICHSVFEYNKEGYWQAEACEKKHKEGKKNEGASWG